MGPPGHLYQKMHTQSVNIWLLSTTCTERPGEPPTPLCAASKNINTGELLKWTQHHSSSDPIYTFGPDDLVVAYAAESAGKFIRMMNWHMPKQCLDLHPLFRCSTNRFDAPDSENNLLSALIHFNLPGMASVENPNMQNLARRGGTYTEEEMSELVKDCMTNVNALEMLFPKLCNSVALPQAQIMASYSMTAVSAMELAGIPIHQALLDSIISSKDDILRRLITQVDADFGVFSGRNVDEQKFRAFIERERMSWSRTPSGRLRLDNDAFKTGAKFYPKVVPLAEVVKTIGAFGSIRPQSTGSDGRIRSPVKPFASITGRNQPSPATHPYCWPRWLRQLVRPRSGKAILEFDFAQQEHLIAAALSRDATMLRACRTKEPYLALGILSGRLPMNATKASHPIEREQYKTASLAMQYQCTPHGLAQCGFEPAMAKMLHDDHHRLYATYHNWCVEQTDSFMLGGRLTTPFGWTIHKNSNSSAFSLRHKLRSIASWSVQSAGSDILRLAAISLVERGFCLIAPVHDCVVVECDEEIANDVAIEASKLMQDACEVVLDGETCRVEVKVILPSHDIMTHNVPDMFRRVVSMLPSNDPPYA